jgi:hypothetical protein
MISSLTETYRLWRGMLFREKLKNVRVFNSGIQVKDKSWWGSDNVHPLQPGYHKMAGHLATGISSMWTADDPGDDSEETGNKRARDPEASSNVAPHKRPAWLTTSDNFIARDFQARGGYRGRWGRGNRGRWTRSGPPSSYF